MIGINVQVIELPFKYAELVPEGNEVRKSFTHDNNIYNLMTYRKCWLPGQIWTTYFTYIIAYVVPKCRVFITLQDKYNLQL